MFLIVGLGNPGKEYEHTRHNVGFDVTEILSQKLNVPIRKSMCKALVGEGTYQGEKIAICHPQTFMNLSGESVQALMKWYKVTPDHLVVVYDDIDLDMGHLRIRASGSAGTHNGMRNIVQMISSTDFPRIRVGVGARPEGWDLKDWVLSRYNTAEDRKTMFDAYSAAADAVLLFITQGIESAMRTYNTKKEPARKEKTEA